MLSIVFALAGLLVGGIINVLADNIPARVRPSRPHCSQCGHVFGVSGWLAVGRLFRGGACPQCGLPTRRRTLWVEIGMGALFLLMSLFVEPVADLIIYAVYTAVLILIITVDLEHRLIPHAITLPATLFALAVSPFLTTNDLPRALLGALAGFILLYLAYIIGERLFGPGALGFGDVTLAMMLGAMLGLPRIIVGLLLGFLLLGIWSATALLRRRVSRGALVAYGPFLAIAGIMVIIWGDRLLDWYSS